MVVQTYNFKTDSTKVGREEQAQDSAHYLVVSPGYRMRDCPIIPSRTP